MGAKLTGCVETSGSIALEFDNKLTLVVQPLPNSLIGLTHSPNMSRVGGSRIVHATFEMSTKEGLYSYSENIDATTTHHRRLTLETEHRGLFIESTSFDVPVSLQSNKYYFVY